VIITDEILNECPHIRRNIERILFGKVREIAMIWEIVNNDETVPDSFLYRLINGDGSGQEELRGILWQVNGDEKLGQ
jgi:hypothetical protein